MLTILLRILVFSGVCILIWGIRFQAIKIPRDVNNKIHKVGKISINTLLDNIESSKILKPFLQIITRSKTVWTNKFGLKLLELSEVGINLPKLYLIKVFCIIVCACIVIIISCTNAGYQKKLIIGDLNGQDYINNQNKTYDDSRYQLFRNVCSEIGGNNLLNSSSNDRYLLVEEKMIEHLNSTNKQLIQDNTKWFIEKWYQVQNVKIFKFYHICILLCSFFLPEIILILRWLLRGCIYKKEIIKLEYIFELLARIDGIKTVDIIHQLEKSSKIYSAYLNEFIKIFKYDKRKGCAYLKNKNIKSLSKLVEILEIYSLSDREVALQILEREVMERDEAMFITADETIDFVDLVAFLSIVPLVYELVMLMLRPMLDVIYKAFEFI